MRPACVPPCPAPGHQPVCWGLVRIWLRWLASPTRAGRRETIDVQVDGVRCVAEQVP
jgi:hypothetical protein